MYFWDSPCSIPRLQLVTGNWHSGTWLSQEKGTLVLMLPLQNSPGIFWYSKKTVWFCFQISSRFTLKLISQKNCASFWLVPSLMQHQGKWTLRGRWLWWLAMETAAPERHREWVLLLLPGGRHSSEESAGMTAQAHSVRTVSAFVPLNNHTRGILDKQKILQ